jgi:hypothetical protein
MSLTNQQIKDLIKEIRAEQQTWDQVGPYKNSFMLFERCLLFLEKALESQSLNN